VSDTRLAARRSSVDRLGALVRPLDDAALDRPAYPSEWSIADVVGHLGSAAVINRRRIADAIAGVATPDGFNEQIWAEWNAKTSRAKVDDGLDADFAFMAQLESVTEDERAQFHLAMGPLEFDWDSFLGTLLNEHVVHEWDVAVALDPTTTLAPDAVAFVVDSLDIIVRFTCKPFREPSAVSVRTTAPDRSLVIGSQPDGVIVKRSEPTDQPDLQMPAEAFVRLVYGRLDPAHTPPVTGDLDTLHRLRAAFPGP
jgi:uncharacterized protein (TIGR03083 family)